MKRSLAILFVVASLLLIVAAPLSSQLFGSTYILSDHHGG